MRKKSVFWLTLTLCMFLPLVAACGYNSAPGTTHKVPSGEKLYVLDGYTSAGTIGVGQQIVAFHPGSANPTAFITLPAGLTSIDHQRLYTAIAIGGQTTISVINTQSGATLRSLVIDGAYSTGGQSFANGILSFDGQWLALRQLGHSGNGTTIALIDTQAGKLVKMIHLNGSFDLDAVSPDGTSLYLLQRLSDGSGHYYVMLYNVSESKLYNTPIVDKTEINDPRMTGTALARQIANNGSEAYTLYIDTYRNMAFIHILPMNGESFPLAHCVDLPVGKSADLLHYYTLTISADGSTLYAANGALGVASAISVNNPGGNDIWNDKVEATVHFNPGEGNITNKTRMFYNGAALSADGNMLYFAGMHGIWAVNTSDLHAQRNSSVHYLTQQSFTGIGLSADGRTLYAVDPGHGITLLDTATGQIQQVIQGPAHTPWGIEWIAN